MKKLLTVKELAAALAVSELTVRRMIKRGQLTAVRINRSFRFEQEAVDAFLANVRTGPAAKPPTPAFMKAGLPEGRKS